MSQSHGNASGATSGSFASYASGFMLSVLLTAIPFALVMHSEMSRSVTLFVIFSAAILQILVHLHYFLHLDTSSSMHWNVLALLLTFLIMVLFVGGTIWIMYNLHYRMM